MKPIANLSIICANYNNGCYLAPFLQSVEASTMWPVELIVVDDGSTDDSLAILQQFSHLPWLKLISFEGNRGFTTALNTALEAATSKYIMRADPDDLMLPERIEKQYQFMENNPEIDILGCNFINFDDKSGNHIITSNFPISSAEINLKYYKGEHGLAHATVCGKTGVYKKYRYQKIYPGEDYELFARMVRDGLQILNLAEPLYKVRVHSASSTSNISLSSINQTYKFRDEIFGTKTPKFKIWCYYNYIKHYRKFQLSQNPIIRYGNLILAGLLYPQKILTRIK